MFHADDTGAIMVIGVFMAMMVTGFLYYIIGIGNTIIYRERMQDAADAIAFSGAVMHARGMNLIALINIIMALLMAIYIAMKVVDTALLAAIIFCSIAFLICGELVPPLETAEQFLDRAITTYQRSVLEPALRLGHSAEDIIRQTWPILAQTRVLESTLGGGYRPPVSGGALLPLVPRNLPVHDVNIISTCRHGGQYVASLILLPLEFIPGISAVLGPVRRFIGDALGRVFCIQDRRDMRPFEIDPGSNDCRDGMPGQDCEYVQIRGVVFAGSTPFDQNNRGVAVANWGRSSGGSLFGAVEPLTRFSAAQAEYYYEGDEARDEWTWHMYWRARFRRLRFSGDAFFPGFSLDMSLLNRIIVH